MTKREQAIRLLRDSGADGMTSRDLSAATGWALGDCASVLAYFVSDGHAEKHEAKRNGGRMTYYITGMGRRSIVTANAAGTPAASTPKWPERKPIKVMRNGIPVTIGPGHPDDPRFTATKAPPVFSRIPLGGTLGGEHLAAVATETDTSCMGGWCTIRASCARYHSMGRDLEERLCPKDAYTMYQPMRGPNATDHDRVPQGAAAPAVGDASRGA